MKLLEGKSAVITGANRGIGRAMLEMFASHGADIWACARAPSEAFEKTVSQLAGEHGVEVTPVHFDLADEEAVKAAAKAIASAKRPIDVIVNNAGAIEVAAYAMTRAETFRRMIEVNFTAQMMFTQVLVRSMMRQRRGSIVNVASSAAIEGNEGRAAYAASKAALIAASKVMARELGPAGLRVNAVAPGLTDTDMMRDSTPDDALARTIDRLALRRVGEPAEIAGAALFLASDLSSYMTGQVLSVDGGM